MLRTLRNYLGKDLAKATAMATVAFTLVMTVFAVIEPLRKRGMSSQQALKLFGYIAPVMFSLTLPIAALFAATIVYGRFSRDNELMACRASGISTLSLLRPAIWLGAIVSLVTLILSFYIAPNLLCVSERTVKRNLKQIVYSRLKKQRYVKFSKWVFHADRVDPSSGWVEGVVGVDYSDPDDARCLIAASAKLDFMERTDGMFVKFHPTNPTFMQQRGGDMGMAEEFRLRRGDLPTMKDEPKFYDWIRLWRTWSNPDDSPVVLKAIIKIKRQVCIQKFYEDLIGTIGNSGKYDRLTEFAPPGAKAELSRIVIEAAEAHLRDGAEVCLAGSAGATTGPSASSPGRRGVVVRLYTGQRLDRRLWAKEAQVRGVWDNFRSAVLVTLTLNDVTIADAAGRPEEAHHQVKYEMGPFAVPAEIVAASERINPLELYKSAEIYGDSPQTRKSVARLHEYVLPRLLARVRAEIHQRLAYGISCLLMVMLGAALGLLFRGGEALVAFAISAAPASAVIVLILMGKQLIANRDVPDVYGMAIIWGGIAALVAATTYLYAVRMRR